jgi:hypothetical protein
LQFLFQSIFWGPAGLVALPFSFLFFLFLFISFHFISSILFYFGRKSSIPNSGLGAGCASQLFNPNPNPNSNPRKEKKKAAGHTKDKSTLDF